MGFLSTLGHAIRSRTVWVGAGTTVLGASQLAATYAPQVLSLVPPTSKLGAGITALLGIATIIARINAKQPLGPVIDATIAQTVEAVHVLGSTTATTAATGRMVATTTIANPLSIEGKVMQVAQVTAAVKAVQSSGATK
jgi:hypothetical protein